MKERFQIIFRDIRKSFLGKKPIFEELSLEVERGEFVFLTGVSGAGKSTIFKLLIGLEQPDKGTITFNNKRVNGLSHQQMALHRRKIGVVFQDYKLLVNKTAEENIAVPLQIQGMSSGKIEKQVKRVAEKMKIESLLKQQVKSLSGGEQQLVAIARASIHGPKLILADEPTANLDQKMAARIVKMLQNLNEEGITVIIATHDVHLIKSLNKRIMLIKNNHLVQVNQA